MVGNVGKKMEGVVAGGGLVGDDGHLVLLVRYAVVAPVGLEERNSVLFRCHREILHDHGSPGEVCGDINE